MRGAMLASVIVIGSVSVSMAFPVAPQSAAPEAVSTYGCHHTYVQDATGWHRHTRGVPNASRGRGPEEPAEAHQPFFDFVYQTTRGDGSPSRHHAVSRSGIISSRRTSACQT
jgi:hypothetical protein